MRVSGCVQRTIPATCTFVKFPFHYNFIPISFLLFSFSAVCVSVCLYVYYDCFHDQKQVQARQSNRCHSYHHLSPILDLLWCVSDQVSLISFFSTDFHRIERWSQTFQLGWQVVFLLQLAQFLFVIVSPPMLTIPSWGPSGHPPWFERVGKRKHP